MPRTLKLAVGLFLLVLVPLGTFAQTPEPPTFLQNLQTEADYNNLTPEQKAELEEFLKNNPIGPSLAGPQVDTPAGTVNCFDYYRFGSVQVDLSATLEQTVPGVPMTFTGELKNENPYPVVNGSIYVKIFKTGEENFQQQNGYPLVAFFEAGKDIRLPASSSVPFTFDWQVPNNLAGGDYEANFFFVTSDRFNLLGLSFTDDVTGNKTSFHVTTEQANQVVFDKHAVTLNDQPYSFAAFPPHVDLDAPVTLAAPIINPSNTPKTVTVSWQLYNWDGLRSDFLLETRTESVTIPAKSTKTVSYTATKQMGTVSYLIATVEDGDATSIINPRFVRDNIEETRLNFPSLLKFPLMSGEENTLFSCVHSTNLPLVEDNTLSMTLTDTETGFVIHEYTYQGGVTGAMMGVADTFTSQDNYGKVTLTTTLKRNGEAIDTVTQTYDCSQLSTTCPTKKPNAATTNTSSSTTNTLLVAVVILLIVIGAFFWYRQRQTRDNIIVTNPTDY